MTLIIMTAVFLAANAPAAPAEQDRELVRVNGTPIRQSEILERLWRRHGPQALEEMIDETLLRQAARAAGIKVPDAEIERRVKRLESRFASRALFISQLEQAGSSLARLRGEIEEEAVREALLIKSKSLSVSDKEVREAFAQNKDQLGEPEAIHLRHILVKTEKESKEVLAKIKAGEDFSALARELSQAASGKSSGGDYGFVARGMLPPDVDQAAFALAPGEIKAMPGPRGWHILQSLEKRAAKPADFEAVKGDLKDMILGEKIKNASDSFLRELRAKADIKPRP
jgi:foldase protein PrsA